MRVCEVRLTPFRENTLSKLPTSKTGDLSLLNHTMGWPLLVAFVASLVVDVYSESHTISFTNKYVHPKRAPRHMSDRVLIAAGLGRSV